MTALLDQFTKKVIANSSYTQLDENYLKNRFMALVGEEGVDVDVADLPLIDLKDQLVQVALQNGMVGETMNEQDNLGAQLMDYITPAPSQVNQKFWEDYQQDPQVALENFYDLSKANDYVKVKAIAKNIYYTVDTQYGPLEITINLSKPEKDPKAIAAAKTMKQSSYPMCQLCMENEGYQGRVNYPARANHRIIRFDMQNHTWGFQYSPYAYFNEHAIFLDSVHQPMVINQETFAQLLEIVDTFKGYFAGSNADLPIVGGSILTHEHYQGGRHVFAMEKAPVEKELKFAGFEDVKAGIVKWPMSVIRLNSANKESLLSLAGKILNQWQEYSDESVQVVAKSNGELHHTITPIARKKDGNFELDLVLRDNQTSAEFPDGIYHPHKDVQHIKKENIGLIEVMGLAILPPRLKDEMFEVQKYLLGEVQAVADYHQVWADELKTKYAGQITADNVDAVVKKEVGLVFSRVLQDAGVFKDTADGHQAFMRFAQNVGLVD